MRLHPEGSGIRVAWKKDEQMKEITMENEKDRNCQNFLFYADDLVVVSANKEDSGDMLEKTRQVLRIFGLKMNDSKTEPFAVVSGKGMMERRKAL